MHLINKEDTEYTGQETFVWKLYQERCWDFFPVGDCFRKQNQEKGVEAWAKITNPGMTFFHAVCCLWAFNHPNQILSTIFYRLFIQFNNSPLFIILRISLLNTVWPRWP